MRRAETDGLAVLDGGAPVGVRVRGREVSAQAVSSATGSNDANMPTFGTIGTSLKLWQSQHGDTSSASAMWNDGRPSTTALAYSAILQLSSSFAIA